MLAQGLVLWQWLKPWNHVYRHMLIVYSLSHSQLSTLVVYKNAQLTRGDVFTASTTPPTLKRRFKFTKCSRGGVGLWLAARPSVNALSALKQVCTSKPSSLHSHNQPKSTNAVWSTRQRVVWRLKRRGKGCMTVKNDVQMTIFEFPFWNLLLGW